MSQSEARKLRRELLALVKTLPKGAKAYFLFEGEQVKPSVVEAGPVGMVMMAARHWRPEGEELHPDIEIIPGYQRPQNWRELEAAAEREPSEIEFNGKRRLMP